MTRDEALAIVEDSRWTSTCCNAYPLGDEVTTDGCTGTEAGQAVGLCSDCRDHAMFEREAMLDDEVAALVQGGFPVQRGADR